jgi:hypothetical protein
MLPKQIERHGADLPLPERSERLVCSACGSRFTRKRASRSASRRALRRTHRITACPGQSDLPLDAFHTKRVLLNLTAA